MTQPKHAPRYITGCTSQHINMSVTEFVYVRVNVYSAQMMLSCTDGIEIAPCRHQCREIPQRAVHNSSLWVTRSGDSIWRRTYNPISAEWSWTERLPLILDDSGRQGINLNGNFCPLMTVIALAWRRRQPDTPTKLYLKDGKDLHAKNIRWEEEQSDWQDCGRTGKIVGEETWRSLEGWKIGVCLCDPRYDISDRGRLRNPEGEISSGTWWDGRFFCAVRGAGLLNCNFAFPNLR
jgi:hypothetical protein